MEKFVQVSAGKIASRVKKIIEDMYASTANTFFGKDIFDSHNLEDAVKNYEKFINLTC